jgi:hypothetical protein
MAVKDTVIMEELVILVAVAAVRVRGGLFVTVCTTHHIASAAQSGCIRATNGLATHLATEVMGLSLLSFPQRTAHPVTIITAVEEEAGRLMLTVAIILAIKVLVALVAEAKGLPTLMRMVRTVRITRVAVAVERPKQVEPITAAQAVVA